MSLIGLFQAIFISFSAIFLMELGDKTQLTAFTLSMKYRSPLKVFLGTVVGLLGVTIIAVILGVLMKNTIELSLLKPIIGVFFILGGSFFIINQLIKKNDESIQKCLVKDEFCDKNHENCPDIEHCEIYLREVVQKGEFFGSFSIIFLAELGDKTMLMGIGLATQIDPLGVLLGAMIALTLVNGVGVYIGEKMAAKIPRNKINYISGLMFTIIGFIILLL